MDRLSQGEKIAGGAALLLVVLSFLPLWAKLEVEVGDLGEQSDRYGGWSAASPFIAKLAFVLAIVALALVIARAAAVNIDLPIPVGLALTGLGALATLLLLITLLTGPVGDQGTETFAGGTFEYSRGIGMLIGWIVAAGIAVGGYMHMQNENAAAAPPPATPSA
ncbi:MAG: hypothetical protein M3273_04290 [Actinomycetota bacterium]|nr:hypothetical protein [Actinomycetota bacterium]